MVYNVNKISVLFFVMCLLVPFTTVNAALTITVVEDTVNSDIDGNGSQGDDIATSLALDDLTDFPGADSIISNDGVDYLLLVGNLTLFAEESISIDAPIGSGFGPGASGMFPIETEQLNINAEISSEISTIYICRDSSSTVSEQCSLNTSVDSNLTVLGDLGGSIDTDDTITLSGAGDLIGSVELANGNDTLKFSGNVEVNGTVDTGAGTDTLDYSSYSTVRSVVLTGMGTTDGFAGTEPSISSGFDNIDMLIGSSADGDLLTGLDAIAGWLIDTNSTYTSTNTLTFSQIDALTGGSSSDNFTFTNSGNLAGAIDGGAGIDILTGDNDGNEFTISGNDAGTLTGKTSGFSNIENITGGAGADIYTFAGGSLSGTINSLGSGDLLQGKGTLIGGFDAGAGTTIAPGSSPGILGSGSASFSAGSNYAVELYGTTPGSNPNEHDQLNVTGTVNLDQANLKVSVGFSPVLNDVFIIINNDGSDTITGTFAGIAEGDSIVADRYRFIVSYIGGDGNDVTLTMVEKYFPWELLIPALKRDE